MRYLELKHNGKVFTNEKEINKISLFFLKVLKTNAYGGYLKFHFVQLIMLPHRSYFN